MTWPGWLSVSASGASSRLTIAPGFRWPAVLGEESARSADDHWWSDSPAHAWPTRSADSRENPVADIGVSPWAGRNGAASGVALYLRYHAGGVRRQAAPAGPRVVWRMQRRSRMNLGRQQAGAAQQQRQFPLTSH
jgi:hypothetical protein